MKTIHIYLFLAVFLATINPVWGQSSGNNVYFESQVRKLAEGFRFTEGPASDEIGNIYFTDIPNSRIHKLSLDGELSTFMENTGGANGLYFDKKGRLIACAGRAGKLIAIDKNGNVTTLADEYQGKPLNSPNDLWLDPNDAVYFTDPRYGSRENLSQDGEHVYFLSSDRQKLVRIIDDMVRPNGIVGTPDGKRLYVADHGANRTYSCKINPDGTLSDKKLFAKQGSDGMTLDEHGNLYLTTDAVTIYNPAGKLIKTIDVPERPSNVCFGGLDRRTLFITARTSLYAIDKLNRFHTFSLNDIDGNLVSLSQYRGKTLLVVNVASKCGFTPQYKGLQDLYETYKDQGFAVLAFPANNFGNQEPGTDEDIKQFCSSRFDVTFPMFSKISVKGENIHPLYAWLTSPEENGEFGKPIAWNFNKFLIDRRGNTVARFSSRIAPGDPILINALEKALKE